MLNRTPLFAVHQKLGARLVEFGGWEMPVQYTGIVEEHVAVRKAAGVFDISHMGVLFVGGSASAAFLNATLTNDVHKLAAGHGQYTLMCNERGGVIDDLYVYHVPAAGSDGFILIVNASRRKADVAWLQRRISELPAESDLVFTHAPEFNAAVAVQGPKVRGFIDEVFAGPGLGGVPVAKPSLLNKNQISLLSFGNSQAWVACTGYTGEDGYEIIARTGEIEAVWSALLDAGAKPCGLGARDTLRTEVCYPLYGHELSEDTTPIEAGVGFFVALDKGDFVGRDVLARQKTEGVSRKCVAFKMTDKCPPPRPQYMIWGTGAAAARIGEVTSGTQSPSLGMGIGMGYVPVEFARPETPIEIEIRGRRFPARVVPKPIYRKPV